MGHIALKRTKFQKGNFKPAWDCIAGYLATLGGIKPSKVYEIVILPYYFAKKTTKTAEDLGDYLYKKTIKNWLN